MTFEVRNPPDHVTIQTWPSRPVRSFGHLTIGDSVKHRYDAEMFGTVTDLLLYLRCDSKIGCRVYVDGEKPCPYSRFDCDISRVLIR